MREEGERPIEGGIKIELRGHKKLRELDEVCFQMLFIVVLCL
jgi:hypothetical protein